MRGNGLIGRVLKLFSLILFVWTCSAIGVGQGERERTRKPEAEQKPAAQAKTEDASKMDNADPLFKGMRYRGSLHSRQYFAWGRRVQVARWGKDLEERWAA